jgi:arylsulfatase A-like enzyme
MKHIAMTLVGTVILLAAGLAHAAEKPNVLFIAVDDLNDWIEPLGGNAQTITPNLSRLAKQGMTFTNAHCASPACHSSRLAVMTGFAPARTGVMANVFNGTPGPSWRKNKLFADVVTLSQHFRNNGYEAVGGGKIYHALQPDWFRGSENDPDTWDSYYPDANKPIPDWVRPPKSEMDRQAKAFFGKRPLGRRIYLGWTPLDVEDSATSDQKVVDWAVGEFKKDRDKPFFVACGLFRPHIPWEVPRKYFDMHPLDKIKALKIKEDDLRDTHDHRRRKWHQWILQNDQWPAAIRGYLASITYADHQIGRLLDGLKASGKMDNTIIVLWTDHGMHIGEKENWEKFTLWEESTRVPLFVVAPGVTKAGSRCDRPTSLLDLYPTLAELTNSKAPDHLDGISLVPWLKDPTLAREKPATCSYLGNHTIRTDHWRYIAYRSGVEELYDHRSDSDEFTNLAYDPTHAKQRDAMRALLTKETGFKTPTGNEAPKGYAVKDGRLIKNDYLLIGPIVKEAKAQHAAGKTITATPYPSKKKKAK